MYLPGEPIPHPRSDPEMPPDRSPRSTAGGLAALLLALPLATLGCGQQQALGKDNTVIVVTSGDSLWAEVRDTTFRALEPTFFTTREEKKFYVEAVDTASIEEFNQLRGFKRVLVFGTPDNRFVREVADAAGVPVPEPPSLVHTADVWARNQDVTAVVLEPGRRAESWKGLLPAVATRIRERYEEFVLRRMYVSGPDTTAIDSLRQRFGFGIAFPTVYDVAVREEGQGPVIVRNDNPDPSELIRSVLVDWRSPPLDTLTEEAALEWRAAVDSVHYNVPQAVDTVHHSRRLRANGRPALEVVGVWSDEGTSFPAAGPFVLRLVQCPERTYLLDAWVYAPGKDRYQYDIQIRHILDSFVCSGPPEYPEIR